MSAKIRDNEDKIGTAVKDVADKARDAISAAAETAGNVASFVGQKADEATMAVKTAAMVAMTRRDMGG